MVKDVLLALRDARQIKNSDFAFHAEKARGEWVKVCPNFYIPASTWDELKPYEQQWIRNVAIGRSAYKAVLIGRAAADLHGLWLVARNPYDTELALLSGLRPPLRQWGKHVRYRKAPIAPGHRQLCWGVRTVIPARAVIDVARFHGFEEGLVAADSFLSKGLGKRAELHMCVEEMGKFHKVGVARRVIEMADARSESPYESLARAILINAGFGDIHMQVKVLPGIRVDLMVGKVVVEVDGAVKYDGESFGKATDLVIRREREREKLLRNHGFDVVRVSPRQLLQSPELLVQWVSLALQRVA